MKIDDLLAEIRISESMKAMHKGRRLMQIVFNDDDLADDLEVLED